MLKIKFSISGQIIAMTADDVHVLNNQEFVVTISYDTSPQNNQLSGVTANVHYDSSQLTVGTWIVLFANGLTGSVSDNVDTANNDGNMDTDRVISFTYSSNTDMWPNVGK